MDSNSTNPIFGVSVFNPENRNWEEINTVSPVSFESEQFDDAAIPEKPSLSVTFEVKPNKQLRKWYRDQTRVAPDLKYPKKKRAWRVKKKWFNRYQKPRFIGQIVAFEGEFGKSYPAKIVKAKICKNGGNNCFIDFCAEPLIKI